MVTEALMKQAEEHVIKDDINLAKAKRGKETDFNYHMEAKERLNKKLDRAESQIKRAPT